MLSVDAQNAQSKQVRGELWVVKLWNHHSYSTIHKLLHEQIVAKIVIKVMILTFSLFLFF